MDAISPMTDEYKVALVGKDLFDELMECWQQCHPDTPIEVEWGTAHRQTVTYYEPTIYELEPHPDPLTVAQAD